MAQSKSQSNADLLKTLSKMDKAYASGSKSWFEFLDDNVIVYTNSSAEPIKGRANYASNFSKLLGSTKRKLQILSRQVQSVGDVQVVYQVVQVTQEGVVVNMKQSQVWTQTAKGPRINHMHTSVLGTPQAVSPALRTSSINVINEKIATVATAVGVAQ